MPWTSLEDVPASIRTHKGAKLTLEQANFWGKTFDDLVKGGVDESRAAAIAWTFFERHHRRDGDRWIRRRRPLKAKPQNPPGVSGVSTNRKRDIRGQRHEDPTRTRALRDRHAARLRRVVRKALDDMVRETRRAFPLVGADIEAVSVAELLVRLRIILQTAFTDSGLLADIREEIRVTITRANRNSSRLVAEAAGAAGDDVGTFSLIFDAPVSDAVVANLAFIQLGMMERLGVDLANRIFPGLEEGIREGESIAELARRIRESGNVGFHRANMIARTETIKAFNDAAKLRYESHGVQMVEWITAGDNRVDPDICEPLEGQRFLIDLAPPNPAHPLCRCGWLPVLIGGPRG